MISQLSNILTEDELIWLNSKCNEFVKNNDTTPDGKVWFYNSMHLYHSIELNGYKERVLKLVGDEYELQYNGIFINKITPDTNLNDDYHVDSSDLTIVTYLNDNFEGGEFEYKKDGMLNLIVPKVNLSILMDREIPHRVLRTYGEIRYSLITWFRKKNKTII
jgi:hypothetical protein